MKLLCVLQSFTHLLLWWKPATNPKLVAELTRTLAADPAARHWLLIIASEPLRLRRALLKRADRTFSTQTATALRRLTATPLLHAVVEQLFRHHGLPPLTAARRTGRSARVRLGELSERCAVSDSFLRAA